MGYEESERSDSVDLAVPIDAIAIGTRIETVAERLGGKRNLANKSGVHETQLYKYIKGTNAPSLAVAAAIARAGGLTLDQLVFGGPGEQIPQDDAFAYIPLYDARISSGPGAWNEGVKVLTMLAFTRYSLRKKGLDPASLCCVQNDGDSNNPELCDGDTVMVDLSRNQLQGDALYVLRLGDSLLAKRLQRQFDNGLQIISANPAYAPMTVPPERVGDLQIVGRVVWAGGWLI